MNFTNNLYTIVNRTKTNAQILLADKTHPIFCAHFPDFPILPGFLQIDIANELFNITTTKIKKAKFLTIIEPNKKIKFNKIK